ncbi:MAG: histidine phosphatase family protein [Rhodobacteraceae bacterium]|nr:histidine phosphatase family protein [Paracoccaceae bacterium]
MTTWWWIRHGPTHASGLVGATDLPADLSDRFALARLDLHLPDDALLVSSDLCRSITTADAIQRQRTRLEHAPEIREINFGDWEGKTFDQAVALHPEIAHSYWRNPGDIAPPGGETWNQASDRVEGFVQSMNRAYPNAHIIGVAHFAVILTQLQRATRISARSALSFRIDNLSVTRLEFLGPGWQVHAVNHIP